MATRYYLPHDVAAGFTPTTLRGTYDVGFTGSVSTKKLTTSKAGAALGSVGYIENGSTVVRACCIRHVSDPIGAQTLTGTVDIGVGAGQVWGDSDAHLKLEVYVTAGDTDTVRGTLLHDYEEASGVNTLSGLAGRQLVAPQAVTSVMAQNNDRLVVEIGWIIRSTYAGFNNGATIYYGASALGGDITAGGSHGDAAWIEFSMTIAGPSAGPPPSADTYVWGPI